jgi:hypothetical protein
VLGREHADASRLIALVRIKGSLRPNLNTEVKAFFRCGSDPQHLAELSYKRWKTRIKIGFLPLYPFARSGSVRPLT